MNEQKIKKILKKYDMPFKERKIIENDLLNRKINKRSIRTKIISQGDKVTKFFCLLSGSVQISFTLSHEIKPKHFENDEEKETIHKMSKQQHFKLTFIIIENQLEFINEEALLQFTQKQERQLQMTNQRQEPNQSRQSQKSFSKQKKQDYIKCKYTATVTSSECEYIEVSFDQAKMLLQSRLEQIKKRDLERQRIIKEKKRSFKLELESNEKKFMLDKISMPNLHSKLKLNLSPKFKDVHSLANLENKVLTTRYDSRFNSGQKKEDKQVYNILYEPIKKVKSVSNMISSKGPAISHDNPFESAFGSSEFHSTQNNLILQRYRQRKQLGNAQPHTNQNKFNQLMPQKGVQDKIFKQNLKKIIRKKLKFQRMHGQIIRQNARGIQSDAIQISNEYEYPIENGELQSQQFLAYQQSDTLVPKLALHSKKPQTSRVLPTFHHSTAKHSNSLNKQQFLEKISSENSLRSGRTSLSKKIIKNEFQRESKKLNDLKKMRKKMEEHAIFLKLQDLDSYFNKI